MKKVCVFCGNTPQNKNREHVLPQWLLEMTGNPNRVVNMALNYENGEPVRFSWKSLVVPACEKCNSDYSDLEDAAKSIIQRLANDVSIPGNEYLLLLDWLDKVRTGLWINILYLSGNPLGIQPHFHVDSRTGVKDRMVALYRFPGQMNGLNAFGINTFIFQRQPSCFGLRINNIYLFNLSADFYFCRRLGFPYPKTIYTMIDGENAGWMHCGDFHITRRLNHPIVRTHIYDSAIQLYQPIMLKTDEQRFQHGLAGNDWAYDAFLAENCLHPFTDGKGKLFRQHKSHIERIDDLDSPLELEEFSNGKFNPPTWKVTDQVLKFQQELFAKSNWKSDDRNRLKSFLGYSREIAKKDLDYKNQMIEFSKLDFEEWEKLYQTSN